MYGMFQNAAAFGKKIDSVDSDGNTTEIDIGDIGSWDTSRVSEPICRVMFDGAASFRQSLAGLELDSLDSDGMTGMLDDSGLSWPKTSTGR